MITRKLEAKSKAGGIFIELIALARLDISERPIRKIAITIRVFPLNNPHNGLLLLTIWKLERKTPNENRKTIIPRIIEITVFLPVCIISGRNFEKNRIINNVLNIDLSIPEFSSELLKPI